MTVKDTYPLPRMVEWINERGDAHHFINLDTYFGYWQMKIRKKDRPKKAFLCNAETLNLFGCR